MYQHSATILRDLFEFALLNQYTRENERGRCTLTDDLRFNMRVKVLRTFHCNGPS